MPEDSLTNVHQRNLIQLRLSHKAPTRARGDIEVARARHRDPMQLSRDMLDVWDEMQRTDQYALTTTYQVATKPLQVVLVPKADTFVFVVAASRHMRIVKLMPVKHQKHLSD